ncbi:MAG: potassium transporter TrkA [Hyphomicrobiales bacterium]|nr:potassium transporter TrkA [Hyphomicrobiales bacterium]
MPEAAHTGGYLVSVLIFLGAAVLAVPLFRLLGLGAVIGYLFAGVAIGPSGFGFIGDAGTTREIAELGVVLLLFIVGLELKPSRLLSMRRDILLLGSSQMAVTALIVGGLASVTFKVPFWGAATAGVALAFSATAIALQLLEERGALQSSYGRRAFAVLLMQDILVVPVLALVPLAASRAPVFSGQIQETLASLSASGAALAVVIFAGRYLLNPMFRILAKAGAREVMTAAALLVVLGTAVLMQWAGMSMALGAFLAGLLLSESHFRHELEADIEPFRGLLMGLFFMSVGMSIDGPLVISNALFLLAAAAGVIAIKSLVTYLLMKLSGSTRCESLSAASVLTPAGEFSFVVFPLAASNNLLPWNTANLLSAIAALTMVAGPLVAKAIERFSERTRPAGELPPAEEIPDGARGSVLVIGFGRFGQMAVQVLLAERVDVTVIDADIERIRNAARFGFKVYFGDGTRLDVLRASGAAEARIIAICVDKKESASLIVELVKQNFPLARIHVRAYDRIHAIELVEKGADYLTRETFESALVFGAATLSELIEDADRVAQVVEGVRRRDLQRLAVQQAGGSFSDAVAAAPIQPEPLTPPLKKARGLSVETQDIVQHAEDRPKAPKETAS